MDRNCDAFIRSNNTYDILIARESLEISDDRAECIKSRDCRSPVPAGRIF